MIEIDNLNSSINILKYHAINAPETSGIYKMIDKHGALLYIGKAKNLQKRLSSYTKIANLNNRLQTMVSQINTIETVQTSSEEEALLLEADLIKNLKPRYNILLRDDKTYPYILIRTDHPFSPIIKYRGEKTVKGRYFGPFASVQDVKNTIATIQKLFLLRTCSDNYFATRLRPCLLYQTKRCSAPCVGKISEEDYLASVHEVYDFLSGKAEKLQQKLQQLMQKASNNMHYELAALYRDRLNSLKTIVAKNSNFKSIKEDTDIIAIYQKLDEICVSVFFLRNGHNYGNKNYFLKNNLLQPLGEILGSFIEQFYQLHTPPKEIIVNEALLDRALLQNALTTIAKNKVKIIDRLKKDQLNAKIFAEYNAQEALTQRLRAFTTQHQFATEIQKLFKLPTIPKRIEVYDNSHIMGSFAVGVMVVIKDFGFDKSAYRKFNIKSTTDSDDYMMLKEVLTRRLMNLKKKFPQYTASEWPDFLLIDGGAGHLKIVMQVLRDLNLSHHLNVACIAKGIDRNAGKEQFFTPSKPPFTLDKNTEVMKYLQIIRDEAHRFAITTHRAKRSKALTHSSLDNIPDIGKVRKQILLSHFGSIKAITEASFRDLAEVKFIGKKIAKVIHTYLHEGK
ncbi:Excinuclease ABC subunit C [Rickettsiales bacterium Ac37b]|nr:Excinuclease ABC subunit C [Rickettsiales bacterium Ac37b]